MAVFVCQAGRIAAERTIAQTRYMTRAGRAGSGQLSPTRLVSRDKGFSASSFNLPARTGQCGSQLRGWARESAGRVAFAITLHSTLVIGIAVPLFLLALARKLFNL